MATARSSNINLSKGKTPQNTFVQSMKVSEGLCIEIVSVLNHMRFEKVLFPVRINISYYFVNIAENI